MGTVARILRGCRRVNRSVWLRRRWCSRCLECMTRPWRHLVPNRRQSLLVVVVVVVVVVVRMGTWWQMPRQQRRLYPSVEGRVLEFTRVSVVRMLLVLLVVAGWMLILMLMAAWVAWVTRVVLGRILRVPTAEVTSMPRPHTHLSS